MLAVGASAFALSALATASASATVPVFRTVNGTFPMKIAATSKEPVKFEYRGAGTVLMSCTGSSLEGEIPTVGVVTSQVVSKVVEKFTGCILGGKEAWRCGNVETGTVETKPLKGTLGWVNRESHEHPAGLELEGEAAPAPGEEPLLAEFTCTVPGGVKISAVGHLIGQVNAKLNTKSSTLPIIYSTMGGKQAITGFEGGMTGQQLEFAKEVVGLAAGDVLTGVGGGCLKDSAGGCTEIEIAEK